MRETNMEKIIIGLLGISVGVITGINLAVHRGNIDKSNAYFQSFKYADINFGIIRFSDKDYTPLIEINGKYVPLLNYDKNTELNNIMKNLK